MGDKQFVALNWATGYLLEMLKSKFRYENRYDSEFKRFRYRVTVGASTLAIPDRSMWTMDCFIPGFLEWMAENLTDDCYYSTEEETYGGPPPWSNRERFYMHFYFLAENDAILFKLRWL